MAGARTWRSVPTCSPRSAGCTSTGCAPSRNCRPPTTSTPFDPGVPFSDTAVQDFEDEAASRAFHSLPERWQLVLWHLEVEGQQPAEVAPLLGVKANAVSALAYRAREGLRAAYLTCTPPPTSPTRSAAGSTSTSAATSRRPLRARHRQVQEHLDVCAALQHDLSRADRGQLRPARRYRARRARRRRRGVPRDRRGRRRARPREPARPHRRPGRAARQDRRRPRHRHHGGGGDGDDGAGDARCASRPARRRRQRHPCHHHQPVRRADPGHRTDGRRRHGVRRRHRQRLRHSERPLDSASPTARSSKSPKTATRRRCVRPGPRRPPRPSPRPTSASRWAGAVTRARGRHGRWS